MVLSDQSKWESVVSQLQVWHDEDLKKHNAIELQAESNFVGYIRQEADGTYSNEVWAWGRQQSTVYANSLKAVQDEAFRIYKNY